MKPPAPRAIAATPVLPVVAFVLAACIFIADTITNFDIAVPTFYTAVVLMSVRFCQKRGVIAVAAGCIVLILLSDLLTDSSGPSGTRIINAMISLLAIATTTYLALRTESARTAAFEAHSQLAHIARVTMLGELTASIAHEINQPLAAAVINSNACLRWLADQPPNLGEARQAAERIVKDANRASDIIVRIRALTKSSPPDKDSLDINEIVRETIVLIEREIQQSGVSLRYDISHDLPLVPGDRVQLQQVILNLILNAIEALNAVPHETKEIVLKAERDSLRHVRISVRDTGVGLAPENVDRIFDAFYTTKPNGMGMGLAISRSIVEAHGGRIWATQNFPQGTILQFVLSTDQDANSEALVYLQSKPDRERPLARAAVVS